MRIPTILGAVGLAAASVQADLTFTITTLVLEGDDLPGVGFVTRIDNIAVNNSGSWLVEVDTDNVDQDADGVLLRDGVQFLREGSGGLSAPAGALVGSFDAVRINNSGNTFHNIFLDMAPTGEDSGVYFGTTLVIQEGDISADPGFTPGTPYRGFFEAYGNDSNDMLTIATLDDPAIASTADRALVRLNYDDGSGVFTESVFAREGDVLSGQVEAVADFGTGPHTLAFNNSGSIMFFADMEGSTATDGTIYIDATLIAQEGSASPVVGRPWSSLSSPELDLNNNGGYVYTGSLSGDTSSNSIIIKDGATFMQEGDDAPTQSPNVLTSFGTGPVHISDRGDVLWYGDWDASTDFDTGIFYNEHLLVQEGVTALAGEIVDTLRGIQDGYVMSDNGRFIIIEAILIDGREGAFMIEIDCRVDFNNDTIVNTSDFLAFLNAFTALNPSADYNCDTLLNTSDFIAFLNAFVLGC